MNSDTTEFQVTYPARRPEHALLLCCARLALRPVDRSTIARLAASGLDWREVLNLAERHGLRPLLYRHLAEVAPVGVPPAVLAQLWAMHERRARRNRAMAAELVDLLAEFESREIRVVAFKGPTLAASLYGDLSLREFGDLDLLVRSSDVAAAKEAACSRGYVEVLPLSPALEAALVRSRRLYDLELIHPQREWMVELHWQVVPHVALLPIEDASWWSRLPAIDFEGRRIRSLPRDELLMALCLHGTKHFWASLGWLVDVAELIRQEPVDWKSIVKRAGELGCRRRIGLALHLAEKLLEVPLPDDARVLAEEAQVAPIAARIVEALFAPDHESQGVARALALNARLCDGLGQRIRFLCDSLFAPGPGEWERWNLPRRLFFLYVPLRLARLARKYLVPVAREDDARRATPT